MIRPLWLPRRRDGFVEAPLNGSQTFTQALLSEGGEGVGSLDR
jgi:hypothetical protein